MDYLKDYTHLNPMQREACFATEGAVLILAGAGSGKTTTLISRIHYMIKYKNVLPYNILAITFTNKAANELKTRLADKLGSLSYGIWALTFHSACVRILREEIHNLGYTKYFTIFDSDDAKGCIKDCIKELNISDTIVNAKLAYAYISSLKNNDVTAADFKKEVLTEQKQKLISKIYELYTEKLKKFNALDFDDLILFTVKLFREFPEILSKYQEKFKYIMVDEYQDTNKIQYKLISFLSKKYKNICVVGDDDQSIYRFRGADITNILNFEKQFSNTKIIKLEENYRSTKNILDAANGVIRNNRSRKAKSLWTAKNGGDKITLIRPSNNMDEAYIIGSEIEKLIDKGYAYRDMAILYRMNALSRTFEQNFLNAGIPHRIVGGVRFFDRKEIKDIVAYLRLTLNENDDLSLVRIINEPARGIGKASVEKVRKIAQETGFSMLKICEDAKNYPELSSPKLKLMNFAKMINDFQENMADVEALLNSVIYGSGYIDALNAEDTEESESRVKNIMELLSVIKEMGAENDLTAFLENVALLSDIDNYDAEEDAITLMTLHSSKGLEFPVVFLVGFEAGIFPSNQSKNEAGGMEEERRLCYVGITRAKEALYLSSARERMLFGSIMPCIPSEFLAEIPAETLEAPEKQKKKETSFSFSFGEEAPKKKEYSFSFEPEKPAAYTKAATAESIFDYKAGQRVRHKKFGDGTVISALPLGNDVKLEISFDVYGRKMLMAAFAKPTIIEE